MVADLPTVIVLIAVAVVVCLAFFTLTFVVLAIAHLAIIGVRELAYRHRQRRRAARSKPFSGGR